ncbi:MAG: LPS-assembly protein LptD [Burkholderiales bacterium]
MQHRPARKPAVRTARLATLLFLSFSAPLAWAQAAPPAEKPKGPATIDAEHIEGVSEFEVTARGSVELRRDDIGIFSDFLRYNREFGRVEADGGVRLERAGDRFFGPRLRYDTLNDTGVFEEPTFLFRRNQTAYGKAERLEFLGKDRVRLTQGSYSSCEPGKEDWKFEARELELDYENEEGRLRDGRLRFFDTTLLWLPFGTFPLEKRRKSGFLTPYLSQNSRRGLELGLPYYWNIAPEQDLTLTPIHMTKRGAQLRTHYRYLDRRYSGDLQFEHMPEDQELRRSRTGFALLHDHQFAPNLTARLDLNKVTDDRYFVDLKSHVRQVSLGNLQRDALLTYNGTLFGQGYYLQGRVQRFQTLQDPLAPTVSPYHRVPQINFGAARNDIAGRFDAQVPGEYARFTHPTLVEGTRFSLNPVVAMPLLAPGYFLTPKVGLRYADYRLDRTVAPQPARQDVTIPWTSVDGGLIFERGVKWFGADLTQTLEPRLFYVYTPFRNQEQLPLFDSGLADFNYATLFSENRFVGGDRFGDANQLTLAVTSRLLGPGGEEMLRATIGQRYHFKNERVGLTPTSPLRSRDQSDILASVGGRVAQHWTFDTSMQYNQQASQPERFSASVRYGPEIAKVVSASYRFHRDVLRQVDVSGQWPLAQGWYAVGRYNYSLRDKRLLEGLGGFEYNAGCWVFRAVFQRLQAAAQTTSSGIFFQLEFNGFGSLGSDEVLTFLKRNVPGYAPTNPSDPQLVPPGLRPRLPFEQVF